jgi:hypothetical protein
LSNDKRSSHHNAIWNKKPGNQRLKPEPFQILRASAPQKRLRKTLASKEIYMKVRSVLILGFTLLLGSVAVAQDDHKIEATADYSYFRLNPGLPSVWNSQNLNGGGAQAAFYLKSWLALAADLQGYGSFTQCPKKSSEFIGCASRATCLPTRSAPRSSTARESLSPLPEVQLGGAHSNFYANACNKNTGICGSRSPSNNAFALAIGGGIDIAVSEHFGIRLVDADYELTRFGNNFTGGNNSQSNFRFQTGVQFRF